MQGPNLSVYLKQLKYLYRPMTPAEEQDNLEARDAATYGAAFHRTVVVVEVAKRQEEILLPIEQLLTNLWKSQQQGEATWIPEKWILIEYRVKTLL